MRLLFLTQVLDRQDAILGFVPRWIEGLARRCERVRVVALETGDLAGLPANVDVRVIGRRGALLRWWRYQSCLREALGRDGFDAVLAHMVPRYALLSAGPARRHGARLYLWYTHAGVDRRLERALAQVEKVFTASPESLRVDTPRRVVTGHGIDLDHFRTGGTAPVRPARILSVGRLTPAKDPLTILEALALLRARGHELALDLVGGERTVQDRPYREQLDRRLRQLELVPFVNLAGEVPYRALPPWYERASVVVNASSTGSLDKVLLEAMAMQRPVLSCSDAAPAVFAGLGERGRSLVFRRGDAEQLAQRIEELLQLEAGALDALGRDLRALAARDHEVEALCARLVREMEAGQ